MNLHYKTDREIGHSFMGSPDQSHLEANHRNVLNQDSNQNDVTKPRFEEFDTSSQSLIREIRKHLEAPWSSTAFRQKKLLSSGNICRVLFVTMIELDRLTKTVQFSSSVVARLCWGSNLQLAATEADALVATETGCGFETESIGLKASPAACGCSDILLTYITTWKRQWRPKEDLPIDIWWSTATKRNINGMFYKNNRQCI